VARINIEDSLYKDIRFTNLIIKLGSLDTALGAVVRAWSLAQKHFLNEDNARLIPLIEWERQLISKEILNCGLAEVREQGIYVVGAEEQFSWLLQKQSAGKQSAKIKSEKNPTDDQRSSTHVERPSTSSSSSSSISSSNSLSNSNSNSNLIISAEPKKSVPAVVKNKVSFKISESKHIGVSQDLVQSWADTYPKEFLELSFKEMRNWVLSNEHKAPKSNWSRFMNSWFKRGFENYRKTLKSNPSKITIDDLNDILGGAF